MPPRRGTKHKPGPWVNLFPEPSLRPRPSINLHNTDIERFLIPYYTAYIGLRGTWVTPAKLRNFLGWIADDSDLCTFLNDDRRIPPTVFREHLMVSFMIHGLLV
jgi:hypothetical protein